MDEIEQQIDDLDRSYIGPLGPGNSYGDDNGSNSYNFTESDLGEDILDGLASFLEIDRDVEHDESGLTDLGSPSSDADRKSRARERYEQDPGVKFFKGLGKLIKKGLEKGERTMKKSLDERIETIKGKIREHQESVLEKQSKYTSERAIEKEAGRNRFISQDLDVQIGHPVGTLSVSNLKIRDVSRSAKNHTYITIAVERQREATSRLDFGAVNGSWTDDFKFDLRDISTDVVLSVYGKSREKIVAVPDIYLGKVIIPLSRLYQQKPMITLLQTRKNIYEFESWFKIYPIGESQRYFEPVVPGLPGTGMDRPKDGNLGEVFVNIRLELAQGYSLLNALTSHAPFKPMAIRHADLDQINPKHIKWGVSRIKAMKQRLVEYKDNFDSIKSWNRPSVSMITLIWWTYTCLSALSYQYPFLVMLFYVGFNLAFPWSDDKTRPLLWNDEIVKDPDLPDTIPKKLRLVHQLLRFVQKASNTIAYHLERVQNSTNSADKLVSAIFCLCLLLCSFVVSVFVGLAQIFCYYFIPFHVIVYLVGLQFILPFSLFAVIPVKTEPESESSNSATTAESEVENSANENPRYNMQKRIKIFKKALSNCMARIPDSNEVLHRRIARTQELEY
mmetsp:Transcript_11729/g.15261  ORF Transcript_11729/g.15261 Transcript_11729/m.15261 type:complete len:617 (+) Transcript_11729:95-1945(+)